MFLEEEGRGRVRKMEEIKKNVFGGRRVREFIDNQEEEQDKKKKEETGGKGENKKKVLYYYCFIYAVCTTGA